MASDGSSGAPAEISFTDSAETVSCRSMRSSSGPEMRARYRAISAGAPEEPSEAIHARVQAARARQQARYAGSGVSCNAALSARQVAAYCALDADCQAIVERACEKYHLSMRAVSRVQKVARTIADLAGEERISRAHVLEALKYRSADGAK